MAGEVDFQARRIDASNFPLFVENRARGNYRVLRDLSPGTVCLYVNQHSKDPTLRPILKRLGDELCDPFLYDYRTLLRKAYPRVDGVTVFPFTRTFVVAAKSEENQPAK